MSQFQFYHCLSKVLTDETGIPFSEKPDAWYESIKEYWENYEALLDRAIKISQKAKESLDSVQGIINLDDFQISPALAEQFRKSLNSENARYWVNACMKLYYDHEWEKAQAADNRDSEVEYKVAANP